MKKGKMTQTDKVLGFVREFGGITSFEAYTELGITQLGARIFELEREGYRFERIPLSKINRYGDKIRFVRYEMRRKP